MLRSLINGTDLSEAKNILKIFTGPALQRGELLFFSIINATNLEQIYCQRQSSQGHIIRVIRYLKLIRRRDALSVVSKNYSI